MAPGTSIALGLNFWETVIITTSGGILSVLFFYYLGRWAFKKLAQLTLTKEQIEERERKRKLKPRFSKKMRFYVKLRDRFGAIGLALLTPSLLSIPIGVFLAVRFFPKQKSMLPMLLGSIVFWSFLLTFVAKYLKQSLF